MTTSKIFNRTISVFAAFLVLLCSMTLYAGDTDAANTTRSYRVFNSRTGTELSSYTLNALSSLNTKEVIGTDDRELDWSKNGVVKLMSTKKYLGSAFVVDAHTIATAAHCVYNVEEQLPKIITQILLFDSTGNISMYATAMETHIPSTYIYGYGTNKYNPNYDYALITVQQDFSEYCCFDLGVPLDSIKNSTATIKLTGFSGDLGNSPTTHNNFTSTGNILDLTSTRLIYSCDTAGGNSGCPVYIEENRCGRQYNTAIAIHTNGNSSGNKGVRITTDLIHFYYNNPNLNY